MVYDDRPGSCDISVEKILENIAPKKKEQLITTEGKEIPADKVQEMQDYARKLRNKFPHMKEDRVKRKVAEYFKIKLT